MLHEVVPADRGTFSKEHWNERAFYLEEVVLHCEQATTGEVIQVVRRTFVVRNQNDRFLVENPS